jgi:hypothetical protein
MCTPRPFREEALELFQRAFGRPAVIPSPEGNLYRWKLERRAGPHVAIYVTLDSPEQPDLAHIMISHPGHPDPIMSIVLKTCPEVEAAVEMVKARVEK